MRPVDRTEDQSSTDLRGDNGMTRTVRKLRTTAAARRALPVLLLIVAVLAAVPSLGQRLDLEPTPLDALEPARLDVDPETGIQLSLDEAVEIAVRRNLGLVIERYNWIQAREGVLQSLGIYDLLLNGSAQIADATEPTVEVVEGVPVTTRTSEVYNLGLSQLLPTGGVVDLSVNGFTQETNSQNVFLNPLYSTTSELTFRQPLLRGFGRLATERSIMIARVSSAQSVEFVEQQLSDTIQEVEIAYWNLVGARNQLIVAREAMRLAQVLHDQNRIRVDVGTLAPLELIQSEAGIANREEDIILAEATIGDAEDELRRLLNLESERYWNQPIVPVTDPETARIEIDVEEAVATALTERPEVAAQLYRIDALEIDERFLANLARPQLDLQFTYGLEGLSGEGDAIVDPETGEVIVPATRGGFGDAFEQISDRDFDRWTAAVLFSYPLQNRERRAQATIADLAVDEAFAELQQLEQLIRTEVRAAARQVETAAKQIESARVSRELEEQNLDAERKRYENGMSSSFRVLEIQEDLTQARSREVNAVASYRRALASFYRAIGRLVDQKGIDIEGEPLEIHRFGGWGGVFDFDHEYDYGTAATE